MTPIRTERLILRRWEERDRPLFHRINCEERVMRFFPVRRDRAQSDALMDLFCATIDRHGFGFAAAEIADTGEAIGLIGLQPCDVHAEVIKADAVEIGWRLAPEFWGKGYASEGAKGWLDFGFQTAGLNEVIAIAVHDNEPSTAVMRRIGMQRDPAADFDHPGVPDTHAHLRPHVLYRMGRAQWAAGLK